MIPLVFGDPDNLSVTPAVRGDPTVLKPLKPHEGLSARSDKRNGVDPDLFVTAQRRSGLVLSPDLDQN